LTISNRCRAAPAGSAGQLRTVLIVGESAPADLRISLSPHEAEYKLFVHSARFGHEDAAALFAAILHFQDAPDPKRARLTPGLVDHGSTLHPSGTSRSQLALRQPYQRNARPQLIVTVQCKELKAHSRLQEFETAMRSTAGVNARPRMATNDASILGGSSTRAKSARPPLAFNLGAIDGSAVDGVRHVVWLSSRDQQPRREL
jgi:hypothetical protein